MDYALGHLCKHVHKVHMIHNAEHADDVKPAEKENSPLFSTYHPTSQHTAGTSVMTVNVQLSQTGTLSSLKYFEVDPIIKN